jgi:hypothetical protein
MLGCGVWSEGGQQFTSVLEVAGVEVKIDEEKSKGMGGWAKKPIFAESGWFFFVLSAVLFERRVAAVRAHKLSCGCNHRPALALTAPEGRAAIEGTGSSAIGPALQTLIVSPRAPV